MSMTSSLMHNMKIHNASPSQPYFRLPVFPMIVLGILLAYGISVQAQPDLDKRMKLLNMLDKLDEQDFNDALVSADRCTYSRNFACAQSQLDQAQKLMLSQDHRREFNLASQRLVDEINRVREEEAYARQLAEEQRQMELERQRFEAEREEWEAEQRRIAREMEYEADHDPYNTGTDWQMIMSVTQAGLDAYADSTRQKQQARREQLAAQQQANEINRSRREREQAARQQDYYQRKQAYERSQREYQKNMEARRFENERRQRASQQREAEYAQRLAQAAQPTMHAGYSPMGTDNKSNNTTKPAKKTPQPRTGSIQQGPMTESDTKRMDCPSCKGILTKTNLRVGECQIESMTVSYNVGPFMGEPTVNGNYTWTEVPGTADDCLPANFTIWLKINNYQASGYIRINPVVPKASQSSFSGTAGSPNWDNFICGFDGGNKTACFNDDDAKRLLRKASITDFELGMQ